MGDLPKKRKEYGESKLLAEQKNQLLMQEKQKIMQILKEVHEDKTFKAFFSKFE